MFHNDTFGQKLISLSVFKPSLKSYQTRLIRAETWKKSSICFRAELAFYTQAAEPVFSDLVLGLLTVLISTAANANSTEQSEHSSTLLVALAG